MPLYTHNMLLAYLCQSSLPLFRIIQINGIACHIHTQRTINAERKHRERDRLIHITSPIESTLVRMTIVSHIHIEIAHVAKDDRVTVIGCLINHFIRARYSIPAIHTGSLAPQLLMSLFGMPQSNFLPTTEFQSVLLHHIRHLRNEILRQIMSFRHAFFLHQFLTFRGAHPHTARHFVTTQMHCVQ